LQRVPLKFLGKVENNMATKKAAKKAPKKAAKKAPARKVAKKVAPKKKAGGPITDKMTKGQIVSGIADSTGLTKKQVIGVLEEFQSMMERSISKRGIGEFTFPGILKVSTRKKPAKPAHKGIDPFTKLERMFKAKPASIQVKIRPLKNLKEAAQ
jgi:nucleoid DNA-binding protein